MLIELIAKLSFFPTSCNSVFYVYFEEYFEPYFHVPDRLGELSESEEGVAYKLFLISFIVAVCYSSEEGSWNFFYILGASLSTRSQSIVFVFLSN